MDSNNDKATSFFGPNFLVDLIDLLPTHIFWKNTEGVYLGCNSVFARGLGFTSSEDIIGKTDYDFPVLLNFSDQYRKDDIDIMRNQKARLRIEESQIFADGKKSDLLTSKVPIFDDDNRVVGVLGIYSDITEDKRAERLSVQNKLQEKQLEGMKLLANAIAHELRTPLSGIGLGMSTLHQAIDILKPAYDYAIANGYRGKTLSTRVDRNLHRVVSANKNQVRAGLTCIDLMLANATSGSIVSDNFSLISVSEVLALSLSEYPFQDEQERGLVKVDVMDNFSINGDAHYIKLVFFNLIKNALYFIKAANKGTITIQVKTENGKNTILFEDTAQGVEVGALENIFDRFYSKRNGGSGIGLAFCKEVISAHNGSIDCESKVGEYARFIMSFPSNSSPAVIHKNCV